MKIQHFAGALAAAALFLSACKSKDSNASPAAAPSADTLRYEMRNFVKHHCVNDDQCADFNVIYPDLTGADSNPAAAAIKKAVSDRLVAGLGGNRNLSFELALDSAATAFINDFIQLKRDVPEQEMGQTMQVTGGVLVNNPKIATIRLDFNSFTGGAHPNSASAVMSFERTTGKELRATDMLSDTTALLPLLEKAYKEAKGLKASDHIGQLLLSEKDKLTLPVNIAVVPQGILFAYSDYEVSPHAVGPADIVLTWEQLGTLADRKKWLE